MVAVFQMFQVVCASPRPSPSSQCSAHRRRTWPAVGLVRVLTFTCRVQLLIVASGGMPSSLNATIPRLTLVAELVRPTATVVSVL